MTRLIRPPEITPRVRAGARRVIAYAERHRIPLWRVHRIARGAEVMPPSFDPNFSLLIPVYFAAVLTFEEHPKGWVRHLTVHRVAPDRTPRPCDVEPVMAVFGFVNSYATAGVYLTPSDGGASTVNVIELWSPPPAGR